MNQVNPTIFSRGVALVTALLVLAIATTTVVALTSRQFIDIRRTSNVFESDQAYVYALGIETVAQQLLAQYSRQQSYDDPELMYVPYNFPVEGGTVSGSLQDMQAYFNLNSLVDTQGKATKDTQINADRLRRIIDHVIEQQQDDQADARDLVNAVIDWIDIDEDVKFPGGAEDSEYLSKEPPYRYRTANRLMSSVTELLLIKGFNKELLYGKTVEEEQIPGLLEYVRVLPTVESVINVNTASVEVLLAFSDKLDREMIEDALEDKPFKKVDEFQTIILDNFASSGKKSNNNRNNRNRDNNNTPPNDRSLVEQALKGRITVQSQFLNVNALAKIGRTTLQLNSLIHRDQLKMVTISRTQGAGII